MLRTVLLFSSFPLLNVTLFPICPFVRNKFISESSAFGAKFCKNRRLSKWNWRQHTQKNKQHERKTRVYIFFTFFFWGAFASICMVWMDSFFSLSRWQRFLSMSSDIINWCELIFKSNAKRIPKSEVVRLFLIIRVYVTHWLMSISNVCLCCVLLARAHTFALSYSMLSSTKSQG